VRPLLWLLFGVASACQQAPQSQPAPVTSASPSASAAPAPTKAWFAGAWQGTFVAQLFRLELPVGGVKEWKLDDGKLASGDGKLSLTVSDEGVVSGTASGALGDLAVTGRVEGDRAALSLASAQPDGFHGVLLATQTPEGMKGTLSASSADSLQVRKAEVTLTRAAK
jgi:hypothetical protein